MTDPTPEEMTTLAKTMDWLLAREKAARAEAFDEGYHLGSLHGYGPLHVPNPYRATEEPS